MIHVLNMTALWEEKFDKIYCLMFTPDYSKYKGKLLAELSRVGIWQSKKFEIVFCPKQKLKTTFINLLMPHFFFMQRAYAFDVAFEHYRAISNAYQLGYNRILMLEPDVCFLKDIDLLYKYLYNIPEDYNIFLFDKLAGFDCFNLELHTKLNEYYYNCNNVANQNWSASCYSVDRKAMEFCISLNDTYLNGADGLLVEKTELMDLLRLKRCFTTENIAIQRPELDNNTNGGLLHYPVYIKAGVTLEKYNF